ncbi:uncharacterized protein MKK02DRAFT_38393 [Dioszegia hungarica]|uniref:Uncharacterized protein n=1 Tax=Dioszegia hungarica TaxID=4972 RepID=A0AA38LUE0_9TREE|nr:uncharacterized protein MKK02DRAFT_38393 [Dioszegia hungarica]KAI9633736.1 hypothetical protein MKK02DRAFT_38393 [Dioszegia hungarica]
MPARKVGTITEEDGFKRACRAYDYVLDRTKELKGDILVFYSPGCDDVHFIPADNWREVRSQLTYLDFGSVSAALGRTRSRVDGYRDVGTILRALERREPAVVAYHPPYLNTSVRPTPLSRTLARISARSADQVTSAIVAPGRDQTMADAFASMFGRPSPLAPNEDAERPGSRQARRRVLRRGSQTCSDESHGNGERRRPLVSDDLALRLEAVRLEISHFLQDGGGKQVSGSPEVEREVADERDAAKREVAERDGAERGQAETGAVEREAAEKEAAERRAVRAAAAMMAATRRNRRPRVDPILTVGDHHPGIAPQASAPVVGYSLEPPPKADSPVAPTQSSDSPPGADGLNDRNRAFLASIPTVKPGSIPSPPSDTSPVVQTAGATTVTTYPSSAAIQTLIPTAETSANPLTRVTSYVKTAALVTGPAPEYTDKARHDHPVPAGRIPSLVHAWKHIWQPIVSSPALPIAARRTQRTIAQVEETSPVGTPSYSSTAQLGIQVWTRNVHDALGNRTGFARYLPEVYPESEDGDDP